MGSIRASLSEPAAAGARSLHGAHSAVRLADAGRATCLLPPPADLADRSVLLFTRDPFASVLALMELDGVVRRLTLCTPDVSVDRLGDIASRVDADAIVTDVDLCGETVEGLGQARCAGAWTPGACPPPEPHRGTEWVLLTSGTSGAPKMVRHTFATLTAAFATGRGGSAAGSDVVWGTFYDVRRYGGLQVVLRALIGGTSLVLGEPEDGIASFLERLANLGATHISGTPTHWRRVLMSPAASAIAPEYIRLSGEIADQAVLDALHARYPRARIGHAFASTEAGVGFEVTDGRAGFPADIVGADGDIAIRVDDGALQLRSRGTALGYVPDGDGPIADPDGFVDTGDAVERHGDRYYFLGRRSGAINVGGLKVHPEEIEAAINRHPSVRMSKVRAKRSAITGSVVAADVVLDRAADVEGSRLEILRMCRTALPAHKVPAVIRIVPALDSAATGKLARHAS